MKRKRILFFLLFIIAAILIYNYINKAHRDIAKEEAIVTLKSLEFYRSFQDDKDNFNTNYLDKVVGLEGIITELENKGLVLDNKNYITFKESLSKNLRINKKITIKGRYVGYDDLLEQLKIDQATVLND